MFKRYVNKDLQAFFEQMFCNSCTPLSTLKCQNWSVFPNFYAGCSEMFGSQERYFIMHLRDLFVLFRVLINCSEDIDYFIKFLQSQHFLNI